MTTFDSGGAGTRGGHTEAMVRPDGNFSRPKDGVDVFISYALADERWATWLAWHLETHGYRTRIQAWDFVPGTSLTDFTDRGIRESGAIIALLSDNYLKSRYGTSQWQAALRTDPDKLVPVRIEGASVVGLLATITYIDLVGVTDADQALDAVLRRLRRVLVAREKAGSIPETPQDSLGQLTRHVPAQPPAFPDARETGWRRVDESTRADVPAGSAPGLLDIAQTQFATNGDDMLPDRGPYDGFRELAEVTIYTTSDDGEPLRDAVVELLGAVRFDVLEDYPPEHGSWFQRLFVRTTDSRATSTLGRLVAATDNHLSANEIDTAVQARDISLHLNAPPPEIDERQANALAALMEASKPHDEVVIRMSSILFIKSDGKITSWVLTEEQNRALQNNPMLLRSPRELLETLSKLSRATYNYPSDGIVEGGSNP